LKEFVDAVGRDEPPSRVYKPSGVDKKGERFDPYIRLNLWHHHLGQRTGEPLLILQIVGDEVFGFALSTHAEHFQADKMLWLQRHVAGIDWTDCEDLRAQVEAYAPKCLSEKMLNRMNHL
jgi:hypothetical protein